jgi:hypothetical protein
MRSVIRVWWLLGSGHEACDLDALSSESVQGWSLRPPVRHWLPPSPTVPNAVAVASNQASTNYRVTQHKFDFEKANAGRLRRVCVCARVCVVIS